MKRRLARWVLHLLGWECRGERPDAEQCVLIAAPHTSNWDFPLMLLFAAAFDLKVNWLAKHTLFRGPMGWIMRALGGVPVIRDKSSNMVESMAAAFKQHRNLILVVPTEGTRRRVEYWKSGFYHIARKAGVVIIPSFLDFKSRCGGFGAGLMPRGDLVVDMDYLRQFYAGMEGKFPDQVGPIRLREEEDFRNVA